MDVDEGIDVDDKAIEEERHSFINDLNESLDLIEACIVHYDQLQKEKISEHLPYDESEDVREFQCFNELVDEISHIGNIANGKFKHIRNEFETFFS